MSVSRSVLRTLVFAALYVVATYAGRLTVMDGTNLSLVWPAAGLAAVWFLVQRTSRWFALDLLALTAVTMAVNMHTGVSATLAVFFVVANLAQALTFGYLFRRWLPHLWGGGGTLPLARLTDLWCLAGAAGISTAVGALIGPSAVWLINGTYSWPATAVWLTRNTVSILLIGAAGLRLGYLLHDYLTHRGDSRRTGLRSHWASTPWWRPVEYVAIVVLSAGAYVVAFGVDHGLPLAFPLLVMTVWAGLRLHTGFVILHDLIFGSLAVVYTLIGYGPFAMIPSHAARALVAQLFVGMVAVVGLALALSRDERTALISELRTSQQVTAEQAELTSTIVDSLTEGLAVLDQDGRFLLRNPAALQLMDGVAGDGERVADPQYYGLFHTDGTPLAADEIPFRRALAGTDVHGMDVLVKGIGLPDERIISISASLMPGRIEGVRYAVTVFRDVTVERRHRDELTSFAGVVAHDLLNPLATIEGWTEALTETLAEEPVDLDEAADSIVRIKRAAARMRNLINDLLAHTTARDASIAPIDVSLADLIADIATARTDQAQSTTNLTPVFHLGDLRPVHADPVLLRQLLDNLISNSIKYTDAGVTPEITIDSEPARDGDVRVSVTDNGIGIPPGHHGTIFDNFHRAHRTSGYTGTGLGLGICKRIVERHGGTISASDNPAGPGSRFTFTLPGAVVPTKVGAVARHPA